MPPQKKYVCAFCARAFTRSEHKQRHERSHTNEKPFHCLYCTSAFVRRDLLQRHCRTVHNIKLVLRSKRDKRALSDGSIQPDSEGNLHPVNVNASSSSAASATLTATPDQHPPNVPGPGPGPASGPAQAPAHGSNPAHASNNHNSSFPPPLAPPLAHIPSNTLAEPLSPRGHRSPPAHPFQHPVSNPQVPLAVVLLPNSSAPLALLRLLAHLPSQDPLHLLSISKNLSHICDSQDLQYPVNELFLVGHSVLSAEPYTVFPNSLAALVDQLHSHLSGSTLSEFRLGQVYSVLAVGALSKPLRAYDLEELATTFINKSWNIVVDKLNSAHSLVHAQCDVLKNLFLLTYIYLRYFNNDLMVSYLEDSAHFILLNLSSSPEYAELIDFNIEVFWSIYVLVSKYKANEAPPKFYSWFMASKLQKGSPITLALAAKTYAKQTLPLEDPFLLEVIICTLSNEVNNLIFNKVLWLYDSLQSLHNAIVLANKSMAMSLSPPARGTLDIFSIFRTKLILGASPKYEELLQTHLFKITKPYHWNMLLLTLREFNAPFSFNNFMRENLMLSFQNFGNSLLGFFTYESLSFPTSRAQSPNPELNNNLGIVSFPLIFQCNFLSLNNTDPPFRPSDLSIVDLANLNNLILEWYITIVKVLVNLITKSSQTEAEEIVRNSTILSCLFYMINSNCSSTPAFASTEFYLQVFEELTRICDTWFNFINQTANLRNLRINLNRFLNDLVVLALNNDNMSLGDLYVANESILIKNKRSKSIGSIDMSSTPSTRSSLSTTIPTTNRGVSNNYVLKPDNEAGSPQQYYSTQIPAPSLLAPLQGVTKLNFLSPAGPGAQSLMAQPMRSPPVHHPPSTYVLPPIYAAVKDLGKPGDSMK